MLTLCGGDTNIGTLQFTGNLIMDSWLPDNEMGFYQAKVTCLQIVHQARPFKLKGKYYLHIKKSRLDLTFLTMLTWLPVEILPLKSQVCMQIKGLLYLNSH
jgi:hypothetical protein